MQTWTEPDPSAGQKFHHSVVTIGNFDGLHRGHRALLAAAGDLGRPRVVMTFAPHPVQVLYPERGLRRLLPREDLTERLPEFGVDLLVELAFTREFADLPAAEFLQRYVGVPFDPRAVVAGYDFGFGRGREGNLDGLRDWCAARGTELRVIPPLELGGTVVSSRRLRGLIEAGEVAAARELLGRPFYLRGPVGHGAGRGATIGVPTLNQNVVNETVPATGVYATRARRRGDPDGFPAVTNIGFNPTFGGETEIKVETHVIDATVNWRGGHIDVDFLARLRDERKFAGVDDLRAQIARDIAAARATS